MIVTRDWGFEKWRKVGHRVQTSNSNYKKIKFWTSNVYMVIKDNVSVLYTSKLLID